ncbi:MAG: response regulator, partial [Cyanobacteria bacterium HKST-UBA01]|nr:response regulator [Cyanobacteria bacterium HKST-UBA01]
MRVLVVEGSHTFLLSISISLEKRGLEVEDAASLEEALTRLKSNRYDAILLDLSLPDCSGLESFYQVKRLCGQTPVIIFTEIGEEDLAHGAIEK